jgi:hypothetical protein
MMNSRDRIIRKFRGIFSEENGAMAAWFALFLPVFVGMGALALDISYTMMLRQKLQMTASSAALAGAAGLVTDTTEAVNRANAYADFNAPQAGDVMIDDDIDTGCVDFSTRVFDPTCGVDDHDAVKVFARLSDDANYNNPVSLFLAGIFGMDQTNINVTATAVALRNQRPDACMIALNPASDVQGLKLGGTSSISASKDCGICVNSTSTGDSHNTAAMGANGAPEVVIGSIGDGAEAGVGGILVAGEYEEVGNVQISPDPENSDMVAAAAGDAILCPDPYADKRDDYAPVLDNNPCTQADADGDGVPDVASGIAGVADGTPLNAAGLPIDPPPLEANIVNPFDPSRAAVPGYRYPGNAVYCSPINNVNDVGGGSPVEFGAGDIYIYDETPDADFDLELHGASGNGTFISTEVYPCDGTVCGGTTFIFSGSLLDASKAGQVNLTGTLTDPDGDGLNTPDFLFYQDPLRLAEAENDKEPQHELNGGTDWYLNGVVHMGMEDLWVRGDIGADQSYDGGCLTLLAGTFDMNRDVNLNINTEGCGTVENVGPSNYSVRLVD